MQWEPQVEDVLTERVEDLDIIINSILVLFNAHCVESIILAMWSKFMLLAVKEITMMKSNPNQFLLKCWRSICPLREKK